jgi:predicted dehydrogenase
MKIGIGLYGNNGHQIQHLLENHPHAELVATAAFDTATLPQGLISRGDIQHYRSLEDLLKDSRVELVSLCSPRRRDQAKDAVFCLEAGKHVYAEKPCAMTEEELDEIIRTSHRTGMQFHEMAGTAFEQPYLTMGMLIKAGTIGTVVQVFAQKSYPFGDWRPQDEDTDGGLICQNGIHALRFIEHVTGVKIREIHAVETKLGNPVKDGGLQIAASYMMTLENGGVASVVANYLNPRGFGIWGNEHLRIFGTQGFVEAVDGGKRTRLIVGETDMGALELPEPSKEYFNLFVESLPGVVPMPRELEEELHPTRMVIRAKKSAKGNNNRVEL